MCQVADRNNLPLLLVSRTDVFIKPKTLKYAVEVRQFGINYRLQLNWLTYYLSGSG